jgi:hypothetical protein
MRNESLQDAESKRIFGMENDLTLQDNYNKIVLL